MYFAVKAFDKLKKKIGLEFQSSLPGSQLLSDFVHLIE